MAEQLKWSIKAFDNHPDPMVISRIRDGRIERVNASFLSLFGYNQAEVISKSSLDLSMIEKPDRQESSDLLKKHRHVRDKNVDIRTKAGEILSASLTFIEIEDDNGPRILTVIHVVTELKQNREPLAHEQEIITHLIDNIPVMLVIWDTKLKRFTLNRHAESVLGWTTADTNDGDFMNKVYPDPVYRSEVVTFMQSFSTEWREWNITAKDGGVIPTTWTNTYFSDDTMIGIGLDLRERNRVLDALRESENNNFRIALGNSNFVPAQFDRNLRYRWIYNSHSDFDPAFLIGKRDDESDESQSARRLKRLKQQVIETGMGVREAIAFDRNGGTCWYDFVIEPLRDAGGEIFGGTSGAYDITRQKRDELSLRESEAKYRTLFESIAEGFCVFEMLFDATGAPVDYRWLETNPAFERHTGLVDAIGKTARELVPDLESYWVEIYGLVAATGKSQRFIHQSPAMGRWFEVEAFRIGNPELRRVALLFNDITERKQAEHRLLESEEKYRSLMEQSADMMFLHDLQGHFLEVNQAAIYHTGYSREALLNMTAFDLYAGQPGREELLQTWQKWRIGQTVTAEAIHVRKDGSGFTAEVKAGKIHFGGYDYILTLARDITARKVTEDALQRSLVQYDALFNQMTEGLVLFDPEGNLLDMNPAALAIHGFNKVDDLRQNLHTLAAEVFELFDLEGNPLPIEEWPIGRVLRGETFDKFEVIVWSRKADKKWIGSYGGTLVKDPDGRPLMAIVTLRDVTHLKKSEKALQLLNETLEEKVAERTEVAENRAKQLQSLAVEVLEAEERERQRISSLLHDDLQQLIASARMQVQMAFKADPDPILENVHRLLGDSIEKSRRLSQELSPPLLYQFGIAAGLRWLVRHMDEQFGLKVQIKIEMTNQIKEMPLQIFLFRAAQELLFNIVKHSGVKRADVRLYDTDKGITLFVRDRGEGFSPEILDSFDRKSGLGLLSLRERADAIGGNLAIESASRQGSCFTLTIPISLAMVNAPGKLAQAAVPSLEITDEKKKFSDSEIIRVLFVDDHKVMRQGLIGIIADQPGIQLAGEAANGEEALELARQLSPDVIVMDVSMPKMDGIEATRRIKVEMPEVRIIGLSMFDDEDITRKMRQAGADGFASKSESSSELLKVIYEVAGLNGNSSG